MMSRTMSPRLRQSNKMRLIATLVCLATLNACSTTSEQNQEFDGVSIDALSPSLGADRSALEATSAIERTHLQLIATNLVAALVQIPRMQSGGATLQINNPKTAFGNAVVRALEDAGFGLQRVSADQGQNYVSYSKRLAETESGPVTDYQISVGNISLRREYAITGEVIFPTSLMTISGAETIANVELSDAIFVEQGGTNDAFISGVQLEGEPDPDLAVKTVDVRDYDGVPQDMRTPQKTVLAEARRQYFVNESLQQAPALDQYRKHSRTVLLFDDNVTQMLGGPNKSAVREMVSDLDDNDILLIKACLDADGSNDADMDRAIRVEQELLGYGVDPEITFIAPCARASYRHASDNSAAPVELLQYRPLL